MEMREKLLAGGLGCVLFVGWVAPSLWTAVRAPVTERETTLRSLTRQLDAKEDAELKTMAAISKIAGWKKRALSSDALTAQRVYQAWLTQLADECGWRNLEVVPRRTRPVGPGTSVSVSVEGLATAKDLAEFLKRFEASGMLHAVEQATFEAGTMDADVPLTVSITATALSLPEGGSVPLPYARLVVDEEADDTSSVLVSPLLGGVDETFSVGLDADGKTQIATVKNVDETGRLELKWEDGQPAKLSTGTVLTTQPYEHDDSIVEWNELAARGPFALPKAKGETVVATKTDENKPPVVDAVETKALLPGEEWSAAVTASDPDGDDDKVTITLDGNPPGSWLRDGKLTFMPARDAAPGDVTWSIVAKDADGAETKQSVTIQVLVDPEQTTQLVGAVRIDDRPAAWFVDRKSGERIVRRVGEELKAGRFEATIESIEATEVVFVSTDATSRLSLGERLADRRSTPKPEEPPADVAEEAVSEEPPRDE